MDEALDRRRRRSDGRRRPPEPPDAESRRAAAQEQARWSDLFAFAPAPLVVTDREGVVRLANEAAGELFDVDAGELGGRELTELAPEEDVRRALAEVGARVRRYELAVSRRRHPPARVDVSARLLAPGAVGGADAVAWSFAVVEEREAARDELRALARQLEERVAQRAQTLEAQRARLEAVLHGMPAAVVIADATTGRIVQANRHAQELVGVDVVGAALPWHELRGFRLDGAPLRADDWPLAQALLRGEAVRGERLRIQYEDGTSRVLEINAAPIRDASGAVDSAVAVFWDATERERRERVERDFVTNAAHELQTPLAAIVSAAEVLDAGAKEEPADRDRFLAHIRRECDRLARLVHALLTLARAQADEEPPPSEDFELQPLLDGIALSLSPAAGVEVRVDCAPGLTIRANRSLLEQAVAGLGGNAAKYAREGTIWLRARDDGSGAVEIEVTDDGPGIGAGEEERLFGRFERGGARDASGFGLGLAIVREAVAALGGSVDLRRRDPRGTSARVVLPRRSLA